MSTQAPPQIDTILMLELEEAKMLVAKELEYGNFNSRLGIEERVGALVKTKLQNTKTADSAMAELAFAKLQKELVSKLSDVSGVVELLLWRNKKIVEVIAAQNKSLPILRGLVAQKLPEFIAKSEVDIFAKEDEKLSGAIRESSADIDAFIENVTRDRAKKNDNWSLYLETQSVLKILAQDHIGLLKKEEDGSYSVVKKGYHQNLAITFKQRIEDFSLRFMGELKAPDKLIKLMREGFKANFLNMILPSSAGHKGYDSEDTTKKEKQEALDKLMKEELQFPPNITFKSATKLESWVNAYMQATLGDKFQDLSLYTKDSIQESIYSYTLMDALYKKLEQKLGKTVTADTRDKIEEYLLPSIARYLCKHGDVNKIVDQFIDGQSKMELKLFYPDGAKKHFKHLRKNEFSISKNSLRVIRYNMYPETDSTIIRDSIFKTIDKTLGEISLMDQVTIHEKLIPIINTAIKNGYEHGEIVTKLSGILLNELSNKKEYEFHPGLVWRKKPEYFFPQKTDALSRMDSQNSNASGVYAAPINNGPSSDGVPPDALAQAATLWLGLLEAPHIARRRHTSPERERWRLSITRESDC